MDGRQDDVHLRDLVYNVGHRQLQMCGSVCLLVGLNYSVFILCLLAIFALSVFVCLSHGAPLDSYFVWNFPPGFSEAGLVLPRQYISLEHTCSGLSVLSILRHNKKRMPALQGTLSLPPPHTHTRTTSRSYVTKTCDVTGRLLLHTTLAHLYLTFSSTSPSYFPC